MLSDACKTKKKVRLPWFQETMTSLKNNATPVTDMFLLSSLLTLIETLLLPPLNAMFRFLLRKGVAGHTVVMLLVMLW